MAQLHALKARGLVMQQQYLAMACEAAGCEPQISAAGFKDEDFLSSCSTSAAAVVQRPRTSRPWRRRKTARSARATRSHSESEPLTPNADDDNMPACEPATREPPALPRAETPLVRGS